jgi:glycine dehydrogenase
LTNPANGADVCHLNLHKTFAIPHGGGGPGVGPICVAPQLVHFTHKSINPNWRRSAITISAAPWFCTSLLDFIRLYLHVCRRFEQSTEYAILNANYIKEKLNGHYDTLYSGEMGRAAHEMILECPFKEKKVLK